MTKFPQSHCPWETENEASLAYQLVLFGTSHRKRRRSRNEGAERVEKLERVFPALTGINIFRSSITLTNLDLDLELNLAIWADLDHSNSFLNVKIFTLSFSLCQVPHTMNHCLHMIFLYPSLSVSVQFCSLNSKLQFFHSIIMNHKKH